MTTTLPAGVSASNILPLFLLIVCNLLQTVCQIKDPLFDTQNMCGVAKGAIQYNLICLEENAERGFCAGESSTLMVNFEIMI